MMARCAHSVLLLSALLLAACATGDMTGYPTLEQRPFERRANVVTAVPVAPAVPEPVSATLAQALTALGRDADAGEAAFRAALGEARAVSAGLTAAVGSENWAVAQRALSRAEAARGPTTLALAELDRLSIAQGDQGDIAGLDAVAAVQARVAALVAGQERALAGLGGN